MDDYSSRYNNGQYGGRRSGRRGSRKPNKNLIFDCDFESGNIGKVDRLSEHEYDISIRPDTNNDRY